MKPRGYRYRVGFVPVFLLILCLSAVFCLPAAAAVPRGSLELRCSIERENNTVLLAGDEYALCMVATLEETQELLKQCGHAQLYLKNRRDAIIFYGIANQMDLYAMNDKLFAENEETLY